MSQGIKEILKGLAYSESEEATSYKNAPTSEYGTTFILLCRSGEQTDEAKDQSDRFYDSQEWAVLFAFGKSAQSDKTNLDEIHAAKDAIITALDNLANWQSFARLLKYKSWIIEDNPSYYLLTITLTAVDTFSY
jgi:hypothetical protein